jgi:hypothetical protein
MTVTISAPPAAWVFLAEPESIALVVEVRFAQ